MLNLTVINLKENENILEINCENLEKYIFNILDE